MSSKASREIAISVRNLAKAYTIAHNAAQHTTVAELLMHRIKNPLQSVEKETFWAVKDVSFDIGQGEVVGIIGRNGAGKSTLLKLLSQITEPTKGRIELYGRVGSLLEVGTGFHPELTGRENIYLNGAILGMRRKEIERQFDAIVDFAEVSQFLDTPVKRYSSGMYVRLAFAVAAHLQPEILIVDEVLAVGDATFQQKCLNKMQDVGEAGRTVLFVSHNMSAVTRLCSRAILLRDGNVLCDGPSHEVVSTYLRSGIGAAAVKEWPNQAEAPGNNITRLRAVRVRTEDGSSGEALDIRKPIALEMEYEVLQDGHILAPIFHVFNEEGVFVFVTFDSEPQWHTQPRPVGRYVSTAWIPGNYLAEGTFVIGAAVSTLMPTVVHFYERESVAFQVIDTQEGDSARREYVGHMPGLVRPLLRWTTQYEANANNYKSLVQEPSVNSTSKTLTL